MGSKIQRKNIQIVSSDSECCNFNRNAKVFSTKILQYRLCVEKIDSNFGFRTVEIMHFSLKKIHVNRFKLTKNQMYASILGN